MQLAVVACNWLQLQKMEDRIERHHTNKNKGKEGGGGDFGGFTPPSPRFWDLQDLWIMEYVDTTQIIHALMPSIDTYLYITELSATHGFV